jgi:hypothetical protein
MKGRRFSRLLRRGAVPTWGRIVSKGFREGAAAAVSLTFPERASRSSLDSSIALGGIGLPPAVYRPGSAWIQLSVNLVLSWPHVVGSLPTIRTGPFI